MARIFPDLQSGRSQVGVAQPDLKLFGEIIAGLTREAGARNDPAGVLELFFADKLGQSHEAAIDNAAAVVQFLDTWGLTLTPSLYLAELEAKVGSADDPARLPRSVVWGIVEEDGTVRARFNALARNPGGRGATD